MDGTTYNIRVLNIFILLEVDGISVGNSGLTSKFEFDMTELCKGSILFCTSYHDMGPVLVLDGGSSGSLNNYVSG